MALTASLSAVTASDASFSAAGATAWLTVTGRTATLAGVASEAQGGTGQSALGTGVSTALAVNPGTAGSVVLNSGALGTPTSGVATNLTGTAAGLTAGVASAVAVGGITGLGTGVGAALAINVGTAGSPILNGGALGTPSSGVATNLTGTAAGLTAGNVTTNANLTGPITSSGNATTIASLATAMKIGTLTRVMNAASGDVAYTGVGFLPSKIILFGEFHAVGWSALSCGFDDGSTHKSIFYYTSVGNGSTKAITLYDTAGTTAQEAIVKTFDSDGFTLTWTLTGSGNAGTANIHYLAFK